MTASTAERRFAWRFYPEPDGRPYTEDELRDPTVVEELFDACQIIEAAIFADGWQVLFKAHGLDGLSEINGRSGWFGDEEAKEMLLLESLVAGYDARADRFGVYDDESGRFTPAPAGAC